MAGAILGAAFYNMHLNMHQPRGNMRRMGGDSSNSTDESTHMSGAIACVVGNLLISLSFNLQRLAHKNNTEGVPYTRLKGWWLGLICMFVGEPQEPKN